MKTEYFIVAWLVLLIVACGGSSDSEITPPVVVPPPPLTDNVGGTLSNPAPLSVGLPNIISDNEDHNYFSFDSAADDMLIVHASLTSPLNMSDYELCAASGNINSDSYVGLTIDEEIQSCSIDLVHQFVRAGTHVMQVSYRGNVEGEFDAALFNPANIMNGDIATQGTGRPDDPKLISVDADNVLQADNFYNYFAIYLNEGDEIMIDVYPNKFPTDTERNRCGFAQSANSYLGFGISVDYGEHECYESTYLTADTSKNFVFHFKGTQDDASGYFRAMVLRF